MNLFTQNERDSYATLKRSHLSLATYVNVKFKVFDNHPGVGHKRGVVHEEVMKFKVHEGNFAIIPDAGKHYIKLMKQFNGPKMHLGSRHLRYDVSYNIV